ncbi:MAG: HlyD family type I secretion periplasmic adaptor subunit [Acidiferrobacteraceae bacterium]
MPETIPRPEGERRPRSPAALDFAPGLLALQERPPGPLPRGVLYTVAILFGSLLLWSFFGQLDIIAEAPGHLVPKTDIQIVQPAEPGVVQQILVTEGERVAAGQVLMRMDAADARVKLKTLATELAVTALERRRIRAELGGAPLARRPGDPGPLFREALAQYHADRRAYEDRLGSARDAYTRAQRDDDAGRQVLVKLQETTPLARQQAKAYAAMGRQGYVPRLTVLAKERDYLDQAQSLRAQVQTVASLQAAVGEAAQAMAGIRATERAHLQQARAAADRDYRKLAAAVATQTHRMARLNLRAPQAGIIKDLATHSLGTVVSPGTVLVTLVPDHEPLVAEVRVRNRDVAFVTPGQRVHLKIAAYPFEHYGTVSGVVTEIGPDASGRAAAQGTGPARDRRARPPATYRVLVTLRHQALTAAGKTYRLVPGMQVVAGIHEGRRTVLDYLLSPVEKTIRDSGHSR